MQSKKKIIPIILCGGIGSRLWPLSRASLPKQFISLLSDKSKSMLQETHRRLRNLNNVSDPILICNEEHRFLVAEQMREINVEPKAIILEPVGRNTCPAITMGALKAFDENKDSIILVLSADHKIENDEEFIKVINKAYTYADKGRLVTFGIIPTTPDTGYGYIKSVNPFDEGKLEGVDIIKFIEKPNKEKAEKIYKDKRYYWNSGIFMFSSKTILEQIQNSSPEIFNTCSEAITKSSKDLDFIRIQKGIFSNCPNLSIDVAIMEKTSIGTVLPLNAGWSDIGNWESLWENEQKDVNGNIIQGKVISEKTKNCYLRSENRLVVSLGLENMIIVETSDALLVANKNNANEIKNIVNELEKKGLNESKEHLKIYRPWGNYISLVKDEKWQVKKLEVKPKSRLSLQMHQYRSEHWIVVKGRAKVEINDEVKILEVNESCYIPIGAKHRLTNKEESPLVIIEVQSGSYVGEDDIKRFEDIYGRVGFSD